MIKRHMHDHIMPHPLTGGIVAAILEPLEPTDEFFEDFLPRLGSEVVEVSENSAHLASISLLMSDDFNSMFAGRRDE